MGRSPSCDNITGLKKGPWTQEEDLRLTQYIQIHGPGNWRNLPKNAGLQRCGKSCCLRWINYLRPDIKRGRFSFEEELTIIQLHSVLGNKWSLIAAQLPGRTDNEIKNYWNTHIRKALLKNGIDPVTHHPRLDLLDLSSSFNLSNLLSIQTLVNPQVLWLATLLASASSSSSLNEDNKDLFFNNNVYPMNQKPSEQIANATSTPPLLSINQQWNLAPHMQENNGQCFSDSLINLNGQTSQENMISPYLTDNSITIPDCKQIPSQAFENSSFQPSTSENINFNIEFDDVI